MKDIPDVGEKRLLPVAGTLVLKKNQLMVTEHQGVGSVLRSKWPSQGSQPFEMWNPLGPQSWDEPGVHFSVTVPH